jgi:hypothetical protein
MTPLQDLALTIHRNSTHGQADVRDSDLSRLTETWPALRAVFEEVQYLRCRVEDLEDEVEDLMMLNADLRVASDA